MTVLISLEGGIGSGKSTLFRRLQLLLKHKIGIEFVEEPVDQWSSSGFLQAMYSGEASKAEFQHMALASLVGDLQKALTSHPAVVISERSPFSNYHVFAKANLTSGELKMYEFAWKKLVGGLPRDLDVVFLYLDAPACTLVHRTKRRMREGEADVPETYHDRINKFHTKWLRQEKNKIVLDARGSEAEVYGKACISIDIYLYNAALRQIGEMGTRLGHHKRLQEAQMDRAITTLGCLGRLH